MGLQPSRIGIEHYDVLEAFDCRKLYAKEAWLAGKCGCSMFHYSARMEEKFSLRPLLVIEDDLVFVDPPTGFGPSDTEFGLVSR